MRKIPILVLAATLALLVSACAAKTPQTRATEQPTVLGPFKPITDVYYGVGMADFRTIPFETAELMALNQARGMLIQSICGNRVDFDRVWLLEGLTLVSEGEIVEKELWVRLYLKKADVDDRIKSICLK